MLRDLGRRDFYIYELATDKLLYDNRKCPVERIGSGDRSETTNRSDDFHLERQTVRLCSIVMCTFQVMQEG